VVQKPFLPESRHWCFSYLILGRLQTTVPESVLSGQCGSKYHQYFGRVLVLSKKLDSGRLLGQLPDLSLRRWLHRPLDPGSKIPLRTQVEHPKLDCHNALWTTHRHQSRGLVHSSLEDRPSAIGKWSLPIYTLFNGLDSHALCPSLIALFLGTPSLSNSSAPHSAEAPSTYTVRRDTYECRCSPKDALFISARVLSVWRG